MNGCIAETGYGSMRFQVRVLVADRCGMFEGPVCSMGTDNLVWNGCGSGYHRGG